jgi:cytochrome c-type biogenesis protein CcmF
MDALGLGKISVGPPYFDSVFVPVMTPALLLMGFSVFAKWKKTDILELLAKLKWAIIGSLILSVLLPYIAGKSSPMISLGLLFALWIVSTALISLMRNLAGKSGRWLEKFLSISRSYLGMIVAHLGVAVFIVGVTMVKAYEVEKDVRMKPGDSVSIGTYDFKFESISDDKGPNYVLMRGLFRISEAGNLVQILEPEKRIYVVQNNPMTEAAIQAGLFRDLYISLGDQIDEKTWAVRIYIKPFVQWIWAGCLMMAFGGILALLDPRYRRKVIQRHE